MPDHKLAAVVTCGSGQSEAVWRELEVVNRATQSVEVDQLFTGGDVPEFDFAGAIAAGEAPAVGRKGEVEDFIAMTNESGGLFERRGIPEHDCANAVAGGDQPSVGRDVPRVNQVTRCGRW